MNYEYGIRATPATTPWIRKRLAYAARKSERPTRTVDGIDASSLCAGKR